MSRTAFISAAPSASSVVGTRSGNWAAPAFDAASGNGASYPATTSSGSSLVVAPWITNPIGRSGFRTAKSRHAMKPLLTRPVNSPVLRITSRSTRSGLSTAHRRPIGPPQSWTTTVASRTSSPSSSAVISSTWRSYEYHSRSTGLSERPKPA